MFTFTTGTLNRGKVRIEESVHNTPPRGYNSITEECNQTRRKYN